MQAETVLHKQDKQPGIFWFQWSFRLVIALSALAYFWIWRFFMNADGVAYLDQGDLWWKGDWHNALNAFWSPLYAWLTGLMLLLTKPTMRWEFPAVQLVNFAIFILMLFCFEFFWRELLLTRSQDALTGQSSLYAWTLGYVLFFYVHIGVPGLAYVNPDLLVAAMTYAASGMMLRFSSGRMKVASAALLGCALGIGFLAKTVMLPFGLVVLATMLAVAWRRRAGARLVGVALLGFLAISTPFIAALSWNYHRFTFGDSAKLNAAWFISGARPLYRHWQGNGTIAATPQHPTRKLLNWPEVYEFATPVAGTYPVWYDPTYWWAGIYARLTPALELGALRRSLWRIEHYPKAYLVFVIVALLMLLVSHRSRDFLSRLVRFWPVLVPAAAVFLMYAALNWEPRYTAGAMVVGCGAVIASTMISGEEKRTKVLRATSMLIAALVVGLVLVNLGRSYGVSGILAQRIELAENLRAVGIEPGARIALIGDGLHAGDWARLDKARIIAEVPHNLGTGDSVAAFWKLSPEKEQSVLNILRSTGAQAVVADVQPKTLPPGWVRVGNTGHSVFFFR